MDKKLHQKLIQAADALQNDTAQILQDLIRIRSYNEEEEEIVRYIEGKMQDFGFDEVFIDGLGSIVGRIGQGPLKILWDAHIDTVQVTEGESWRFPPFEGVIDNGVIYGRGAVDEKPAMAGFLSAGKIILENFDQNDLPFTLYVVGSVLEEDCDGYPLHHLIETEGIKPDVVLLGEPTNLRVYRGQRGRMEIQVSIHGRAAHGAHNQQGINAIYQMMPFVKALEELDKSLNPIQPLGKGSITVSNIMSRGPSLCSVPDFCRIHLDRRLTVGEDKNIVLQQLKKLLDQNKLTADVKIPEYRGSSWKGTKFKQDAYFPTWILGEDHFLVRAAQDTAERVLVKPQASGFWNFSTNGVATAGRLGIPTIGFAPGREELAHTAREELNLKDLQLATHFYTLFPFILAESDRK